jgi:NitT/TauT family transport system permease protein
LPASVDWIFTGVKVSAPYALAAAVVGEMLVAHAGLGQLLVRATQMNDMARLYAVLLVIMAIGLAFADVVDRLERLVMWRQGRIVDE